MASQFSTEVKFELEKNIEGEVRTDPASRILYSTDASIYQVEPLGVVFPKQKDDLTAILEICSKNQIPVLPRGSGSSLAGQTVGSALVIDCSRFLNQIEEINPEEKTAWVQPGLVLSTFNQALAKFSLQFGPDPASADRATLGGICGNNSTGAHSISFGMAADHLRAVDLVLADGSNETFTSYSFEEISHISQGESIKARIFSAALEIRDQYAQVIKEKWPKTWRNSSGYPLNYLIPWSDSQPPRWVDGTYPPHQPGMLNLAPLVVGSEGSLAVFSRLKVNLVPLPKKTVLAVLSYDSVAAAADAAPDILESQPSAIELVPRAIVSRARTIPAYASRLSFLEGDPAALLLVEYSGVDKPTLVKRAKKLGQDALILEDDLKQRQLWEVRKVGLGLLMYMVGDAKPIPFIEDVAVPVEQLGDFVREFENVVASYGTRGDFYAHASAGCLHIRPVINLKTLQGIDAMRGITADLVQLTLKYHGALSGEHGDGQARAEWLQQVYGPELADAFRKLKHAADPERILNPGKVVDPEPMDKNLRFGLAYKSNPWETIQDYSDVDGFAGAIEMCNGAGVCRQATGSMCPTFQASREEMHSTRGRANLLRELISGKHLGYAEAEQAAYESLSLCLACKGCKAECPSAVDVAKLKYEFFHHYYQSHRRPLRDYLFGFISEFARVGLPFAGVINPFLQSNAGKKLLETFLGIASNRSLPLLAKLDKKATSPSMDGEKVILLSDPFTEYFTPELLRQAQELLEAGGCSVYHLPVIGAGRVKLSKGFLKGAVRDAERLLDAIEKIDPSGEMQIVGIEPSEIAMVTDDCLSLLPKDDRVKNISQRCYSIEEFLLRPGKGSRPRFERIGLDGTGVSLLIHGHCHQKAQKPGSDGFSSGVDAMIRLFEKIGSEVELIRSGCCGMAGAFGYEKEHYALSVQVGEMFLLPAVRERKPDQIVCAPGASCRAQIESGSGVKPLHPVTILSGLLQSR